MEREEICNQNTNTPLTNKTTDNFSEDIMSCQNLWSYCGWNEVHKHNTPYCTSNSNSSIHTWNSECLHNKTEAITTIFSHNISSCYPIIYHSYLYNTHFISIKHLHISIAAIFKDISINRWNTIIHHNSKILHLPEGMHDKWKFINNHV